MSIQAVVIQTSGCQEDFPNVEPPRCNVLLGSTKSQRGKKKTLKHAYMTLVTEILQHLPQNPLLKSFWFFRTKEKVQSMEAGWWLCSYEQKLQSAWDFRQYLQFYRLEQGNGFLIVFFAWTPGTIT